MKNGIAKQIMSGYGDLRKSGRRNCPLTAWQKRRG